MPDDELFTPLISPARAVPFETPKWRRARMWERAGAGLAGGVLGGIERQRAAEERARLEALGLAKEERVFGREKLLTAEERAWKEAQELVHPDVVAEFNKLTGYALPKEKTTYKTMGEMRKLYEEAGKMNRLKYKTDQAENIRHKIEAAKTRDQFLGLEKEINDILVNPLAQFSQITKDVIYSFRGATTPAEIDYRILSNRGTIPNEDNLFLSQVAELKKKQLLLGVAPRGEVPLVGVIPKQTIREFKTEEEVKKANLLKGTKVRIGGKLAIIE